MGFRGVFDESVSKITENDENFVVDRIQVSGGRTQAIDMR